MEKQEIPQMFLQTDQNMAAFFTEDEALRYFESHPNREVVVRLFLRLLETNTNNYGPLDFEESLKLLAQSQTSILQIELERGVDAYLQATGQVRANITKADGFIREQMELKDRIARKHGLTRWLLRLREGLRLIFSGGVARLIEGNNYANVHLAMVQDHVREAEQQLLQVQNQIIEVQRRMSELEVQSAEQCHQSKLAAQREALAITDDAFQQTLTTGEALKQRLQTEIDALQLELALLRTKKTEFLEAHPEAVDCLKEQQDLLIQSLRRSFQESKTFIDAFMSCAKACVKTLSGTVTIESFRLVSAFIRFNEKFPKVLLLPLLNGLTIARGQTLDELKSFIFSFEFDNNFSFKLIKENKEISLDYVFKCLSKIQEQPDRAEEITSLWQKYLTGYTIPKMVTNEMVKNLVTAVHDFNQAMAIDGELLNKFEDVPLETMVPTQARWEELQRTIQKNNQEVPFTHDPTCPNHSSLPDDATEFCDATCRFKKAALIFKPTLNPESSAPKTINDQQSHGSYDNGWVEA